MTAPTIEEQYLLELVNDARLNPTGNAARYLSSVSAPTGLFADVDDALTYFNVSGFALQNALASQAAAGPLAWNSQLATAAEKHSAAMIAADEQSHQVPGEQDLGARVFAEGYSYSQLGENVYAYSDSVLYAHAGFIVDWGYDAEDYRNGTLSSTFAQTGDGIQDPAGHRVNLFDPTYREVGIDVTVQTDTSKDVGPLVVTQDFGVAGSTLYITGVAYTDNDGDKFYSFGEGRGDLEVISSSGRVTSFASGGYTLVAPTGSANLTLKGGGLSSSVSVTTTVRGDNLKLDVVDGDTLLTSGSIVVSGPIAEIRALGLTGLEITAGTGNQTIVGTPGDDVIEGGVGDDILQAGLGDDIIEGGPGYDIAVFEGHERDYIMGPTPDGYIYVSDAASGKDYTRDIEVYRFSNGDFTLDNGVLKPLGNTRAEEGYNPINGTAGPDTLTGTALPDIITGGPGDDTIDGGLGNDIAVFDDHKENYTIGAKGDLVVIIGKTTGSDKLTNVEIFRFSNADYIYDNGRLVQYTGDGQLNLGPQLAASQNVSTVKGSAITFEVLATDPENDPLAFSAGPVANGILRPIGGGSFIYTPDANFAGTDHFDIFVQDDQGGTAKQTINIHVAGDAPAGGGTGGGGTGGGGSNEAPVVLPSQLASTGTGTPVSITIEASDPDGDPLSFEAANGSNGTVTGGTGGVFTYTPQAGFTGADNFDVTVSDGNGGSATVTVTVLVEGSTEPPANQAPILEDEQTAVLNPQGKAYITVAAFDPDGDTLTFSASSPAGGSLTEGDDGKYTYIASEGFSGSDSFTVTVDDGNGGVSTQDITILGSVPGFRVLLIDGYAGTIGGAGSIYGTEAGQDLKLLDAPGNVDFDTSYNNGGDVIRLQHAADHYQIYLLGSNGIITDGDTNYTIPVSRDGIPIVFADGVREFRFDGGTGSVKIGSQNLTETPRSITAGPDGTPVPEIDGVDGSAVVSLEPTADVTIGGNFALFGTTDGEDVHYLSGNAVFDPSFNRGGDTIYLPRAPEEYSAYFIGSTIVITSVDGTLTIPLGSNGLDLNFDGEVRTLLASSGSGVKIGDQAITGTSPGGATSLVSGDGSTGGGGTGGGGGSTGGGGDPVDGTSLDDSSSGSTQVLSAANGSFTFTDDTSKPTDAFIRNFGGDDTIHVTGSTVGQFSFGTGVEDPNDLRITLSSNGKFTNIVLDNVLTGYDGFIFTYEDAVAAVGHDFMTFA